MNRLVLRAALLAASFGLGLILATGAATAHDPVERTVGIQPGAADPAASGAVVDWPVWQRVTLGRYRGVRAVRDALDAARVRVGDTADEILGRPAFSFSTIPVTVDLVVLSAKDLGFTRSVSHAEIDRRAVQLGLELCPAEVGPLLRLAYLDQPVGEFLRIAMKPVATWSGTPVTLTLANGGAGLILVGGESRADLTFAPSTKLVFVRPQRIALPDAR
jgi:hypothetical protein